MIGILLISETYLTESLFFRIHFIIIILITWSGRECGRAYMSRSVYNKYRIDRPNMFESRYQRIMR